MALNGTYLARAREALEQQRERNEAEQARRERTLSSPNCFAICSAFSIESFLEKP